MTSLKINPFEMRTAPWITEKHKFWTDGEDLFIKKHYPDMETEYVAMMLGRPIRAVHKRAAWIGVHKSDEFKKAQRERISKELSQRFKGKKYDIA